MYRRVMRDIVDHFIDTFLDNNRIDDPVIQLILG